MATHSSVIAWRIPWTEEPDRLQSMGSQESDTTERLTLSLHLKYYIYWQPTPVFLLGKFHGQRSLTGYSPWNAKNWTSLSDYHFHFFITSRGTGD